MSDPRLDMVWSLAFEREWNEQDRVRFRARHDPDTNRMVVDDTPANLGDCRTVADRARAAALEALEKAPR